MDGKMLAGWIVTTLCVAAVIVVIAGTIYKTAKDNNIKATKEWAACVASHPPAECRLALNHSK
jgi:hypothetical protein